jgi:hypothetical protein
MDSLKNSRFEFILLFLRILWIIDSLSFGFDTRLANSITYGVGGL